MRKLTRYAPKWEIYAGVANATMSESDNGLYVLLSEVERLLLQNKTLHEQRNLLLYENCGTKEQFMERVTKLDSELVKTQ